MQELSRVQICHNMAEYVWIGVNMPEYIWIYNNKQGSEHDSFNTYFIRGF